jgi:hypothetical protein
VFQRASSSLPVCHLKVKHKTNTKTKKVLSQRYGRESPLNTPVVSSLPSTKRAKEQPVSRLRIFPQFAMCHVDTGARQKVTCEIRFSVVKMTVFEQLHNIIATLLYSVDGTIFWIGVLHKNVK